MFKNLFKKQKKESQNNKNILIIALLVHAAKIDENYTEIEKDIIKKVIMQLNQINLDESEKLLKLAEKKEEESNQIVEIIWKIVYSDDTSDIYESNLIRRICGLLYIPDKYNGIIKTKVQNIKKKI